MNLLYLWSKIFPTFINIPRKSNGLQISGINMELDCWTLFQKYNIIESSYRIYRDTISTKICLNTYYKWLYYSKHGTKYLFNEIILSHLFDDPRITEDVKINVILDQILYLFLLIHNKTSYPIYRKQYKTSRKKILFLIMTTN